MILHTKPAALLSADLCVVALLSPAVSSIVPCCAVGTAAGLGTLAMVPHSGAACTTVAVQVSFPHVFRYACA